MLTATRALEFDAGHRLLGHQGKCCNAHGHRYRLELEIASHMLDSIGMVVDFGRVKALVGAWIDEHLDHAFLVAQDDDSMLRFLVAEKQRYFVTKGPPTAELLLSMLVQQADILLSSHGVNVVGAKLYETPNCYAVWRPNHPSIPEWREVERPRLEDE